MFEITTQQKRVLAPVKAGSREVLKFGCGGRCGNWGGVCGNRPGRPPFGRGGNKFRQGKRVAPVPLVSALGLVLARAWDVVEERRDAEGDTVLEAPEVFMSVLSFCHLAPPCPAHQPLLQTLPRLHHQVTMEEEDESRGKTEESGEDRS